MNEKSKFKQWQENNKEIDKQVKKEQAERKAFISRAEPVKIVGFDITIMEWLEILFKLNVAAVLIAIPIFLIFMIITF